MPTCVAAAARAPTVTPKSVMEERQMTLASTDRTKPAAAKLCCGKNAAGPVVASEKLKRLQVRGADDSSVRWAGAFASCGGQGATQSSTIVYEIEPGGHLGWHTDATEETQYIIAGSGELQMEAGVYPVGPGSVFVLPTNVRHNLANTGKETLRAVAFFAAAMFTQDFDNVMLPPKSHILGTPNREG
jgi:quercetin dioxygenase-like cupin family protein